LEAVFVGELFVKTMVVGVFGTNCYLVMGDGSKEGFIIDPGAEARKIIDATTRLGLECKAVLCTHGHVDHVGAVAKVAEAFDAPVMISRTDSAILEGMARGFGGKLGSVLVSKPTRSVIEYLEAGQTLQFGTRTARVVPTPGHSPGSMSFIIGDNIFCGDLVFKGSIGRTDLRGGSLEQLLESVRENVWPLGDDAMIYPGHGPSTNVRAEKSRNPYLRNLGVEA
jgi:glyoxylase-like metal-dependent hydrolase (beta-lactamase superfamily II)